MILVILIKVIPSLTLLLQYRPYFPSSVKELAVFVDLAPRFQLMAEDVLQRQIQLVIYNLNQVCLWKQIHRLLFGIILSVVILLCCIDDLLGY